MSLIIALIAGLEWMKKTMNNAEWLVKNKYDFGSIYLVDMHDGSFNIMYKNCSNCIGKAFSITSAGALIRWLSAKHVEPILDDAEKWYLSAVIKPFRDYVQYIAKFDGKFSSRSYEEIAVRYKDKMSGDKYGFLLPKFDKGTMYKGMELDHWYTLKELGL